LAVGLSWDFFSYFSLIAWVMGRRGEKKLGQFYDMKNFAIFFTKELEILVSNLYLKKHFQKFPQFLGLNMGSLFIFESLWGICLVPKSHFFSTT
jgi:hypothetical protein